MQIILTAAEADTVRGETSPGHALIPLALANGTEWTLPVAVLADPAHAEHHTILSGLPQREVGPEEYPQPEEE